VVRFKPSVTNRFRAATLAAGRTGIGSVDAVSQGYGAVALEPQFRGVTGAGRDGPAAGLSSCYRMTFTAPVDVVAAAAEYALLPDVESAQPIGVHDLYAVPNDGEFSSQWHLEQAAGPDVGASGAWDIETGDGEIIVAILDTGIRYFHQDLGGANASYANPGGADGNMWINWIEKNGAAGVDDDANGYVDDWIGWDFVNGAAPCWSGEDCDTQDNDPRDFFGHGTHCAGSVAAINNNGYAVSSVAGGWGDGTLQATADGVKVMACRIGWSSRAFLTEVGRVRMDFAAQALVYAAANGARIAVCSWGSSDSGGLAAAVDYFIASGGLVFHAAGNDGTESADYLGQRADVINVAATDRDDCLADFSNRGDWVDVAAPGAEVLSTWHDHDDPSVDHVAALDGTSMAAPIAAGVAALLWSQNPERTAGQVRQLLEDNCDDVYGLSCNGGESGNIGSGRVNAQAALLAGAPTAADAPPAGIGVVVANYPNPFNPGTRIRFRLDRPGTATLAVYDVNGRLVETLVDARLPAGEHTTVWSAPEAASGVYFGRLEAGGTVATVRMVLLK
jgi:subtilisin family serine protease